VPEFDHGPALEAANALVSNHRRELFATEDELARASHHLTLVHASLAVAEKERMGALDALAAARVAFESLTSEEPKPVALVLDAPAVELPEIEAPAVLTQSTVLDLKPSSPVTVAEPVEVDAAGIDAEELEIYLLSRLLAHRSAAGRAGSMPLIVDDAFGDLAPETREEALALLSRMAGGVQVVYLTDRTEIEFWAIAQGPKDALAVEAPALEPSRVTAG
jgi:hypothetical protein